MEHHDPLEAARERGRAVARHIADEILSHFVVTTDGNVLASKEEVGKVVYDAFSKGFNQWDTEHPDAFEQGG